MKKDNVELLPEQINQEELRAWKTIGALFLLPQGYQIKEPDTVMLKYLVEKKVLKETKDHYFFSPDFRDCVGSAMKIWLMALMGYPSVKINKRIENLSDIDKKMVGSTKDLYLDLRRKNARLLESGQVGLCRILRNYIENNEAIAA